MISFNNKLFYLMAAALLILHVLIVLHKYPLGTFINDKLPAHGDVTRYYANAVGYSNVKGIVGYDPYYMAGYPVGSWNSIGKKGFEICFHGASKLMSDNRAVYFVLVLSAILTPIFLWGVFLLFVDDRLRRLILLAVTVYYYDFDSQISYLWQFGNVFYPFSSVLLAASSIMFLQWMTGQKAKYLLTAVILAAVGIYMHPVPMVLLLVTVLASVIMVRLPAKKILYILIAFAAIAALVLPWLSVLWSSHADYRPLFYKGYTATFKHLIMDVFSDRVYQHHFDRNILLHLSFVSCIYVMVQHRKVDVLTKHTCVMALLVMILSYLLSWIPFTRPVQSYRFLVPALILAIPSVCWFIQEILYVLRNIRHAAGVVAALLLIILPCLTSAIIDMTYGRPQSLSDGHLKEIINKIGDSDSRGRVLVDDIALGHLIPVYVRKPVIGGLSQECFLKHGYSGFEEDGKLMGKGAGDWQENEFKNMLNQYAVDLVVLSKDDWQTRAGEMTNLLARYGEVGPYLLYRVTAPFAGYCGDNAAYAEASYDEIKVSGIKTNSFVLRFHYSKWLEADNGVKITPEVMNNDPVPFIYCEVPERKDSFTIRFKY